VEPLSERFIKSLIRPGDILLYDRKGIANSLIKFVRGEKYSHAAIASHPGYVLEAIQGKNLGERPLRLDGLAAIYRTKEPFDFEQGYRWFAHEAEGQPYDWFGLLSFKFAKLQGRENGKMFCSEFVHRFFKKLGLHLFADDMDSDAVSPGMFPYSPALFAVWKRKDKRKNVR
jgi:hypothetical protein